MMLKINFFKKMKLLYILILGCLISCATETKSLDPCYVDAGIKTAKVYNKENPLGKDTKDFMIVEYNEKGKAIKMTNTMRKITSRFVYVDDKLKYVIATTSELDFYLEDEEGLVGKEIKVDTLFITKNDDKGRMLEGVGAGNVKYEYAYVGCDEESTTIYSVNKKQNSVQLLKTNGNIIERTTTFYIPSESKITSTYIDYKYDNHGHWIERSLKRKNGDINTEARTLEHY